MTRQTTTGWQAGTTERMATKTAAAAVGATAEAAPAWEYGHLAEAGGRNAGGPTRGEPGGGKWQDSTRWCGR